MVLGYKAYMYFKAVFLPVMTIVSTIHSSPQNIDISLLIRYNLDITYSEIYMKGVHLWNR